MEKAELTSEKIADDVQQTYENVSNEYRKLIQTRIDTLLENQRLDIFNGIKRIMSHNFTGERDKRRITDSDKNTELVSLLGSALTVIESQTKDDLSRFLVKSENILSIVPKRQFEED